MEPRRANCRTAFCPVTTLGSFISASEMLLIDLHKTNGRLFTLARVSRLMFPTRAKYLPLSPADSIVCPKSHVSSPSAGLTWNETLIGRIRFAYSVILCSAPARDEVIARTSASEERKKKHETNESRDASNFFTFTYAIAMLSAYGFRFRFSFWAFVGRCVCRSSAVPNYFTSHLARWRFQASNTAKLAIESDRLALWLTIMISSGPSGVLQH